MDLGDLPDEIRVFDRDRLFSFRELVDFMFENTPEYFLALERDHRHIGVCFSWEVREIKEQGLFGEMKRFRYEINYHLDLDIDEMGSGSYHFPDLIDAG